MLITANVNKMIASNAAVSSRWISDEELATNPGLVKTMSVKPPMGTGRVRLIEIASLDLQPCGGTHVRALSEIGAVRVTQIEKKGKQNRRVRLALVIVTLCPATKASIAQWRHQSARQPLAQIHRMARQPISASRTSRSSTPPIT